MGAMTHSAQSMEKTRGPGRPREFDMDEALDKAIGVFRERGFHATSVGDLTDGMQLASGSIYKAFKDKRAVFLAAFDRYTSLRSRQIRNAAATGRTGSERLRGVLAFYVKSSQGAEGRRGCLVVGSAVELAIFDPEIATRVTTTLKANEALLAELIRQGQADGSISSGVDADNTARVMVCLTQGLRVVGKTGRPLPEPWSLIEIAMKLVE
jgi:TetR/AcrR family transcriptional regulator, transcriptional repressor for nem operon